MATSTLPALLQAVVDGQDEKVGQLLNQTPDWLTVIDQKGWNALHHAAAGHEAILTRLLAILPRESIHTVTSDGSNALHCAVFGNNATAVKQLLCASPDLLTMADFTADGWTPLQRAVFDGKQHLVELMLEVNPEAISLVDKHGDTLLHLSVSSCDKTFVERLWKLHPSALHARNHRQSRTPFDEVRRLDWKVMEQLFRGAMSLDELVSSSFPSSRIGEYRPWVDPQCESLVMLLGKDLMAIVNDFIGFSRK